VSPEVRVFCEHCGHEVNQPLPVEPLYSLEIAALLAPATVAAIKRWLRRHRDQVSSPQYRYLGRRRRRLVTASDIRTMRSAYVSPVRWPEKRRRSEAST
jgi:hypothetical protein